MQLDLSALASLSSGQIIRGERDFVYTGIASLDEAGPQDISFLGNEKYFEDFLKTEAGVVIVPPGLPQLPSDSVALLEVENPSMAFGKVVEHFSQKQRDFTPGIHPSAVLENPDSISAQDVSIGAGAYLGRGVKIGKGTTIGANSTIGDGVIIGEGAYIFPNVVIRENCIIGDRTILQPGCVIGSDGFGYEFSEGRHQKIDQVGIVEIGDDCEIGSNTTIDRARFGRTSIGKGCKIDNLVQIAHNVRIDEHTIVVAQTGIAGSTHLGKYCVIAAQVGIGGHLRITDQVTVAGGAGVIGDIREAGTYWGFPARPASKAKRATASIARLPKLIKRVKELEQRLDQLDQDS